MTFESGYEIEDDLIANRFQSLRIHAAQVRVWRQLVRGANNAQIAEILFLSEDTVKTHIRRLFKTFETGDRTALAMIGLRKEVFHMGDFDLKRFSRQLTAREIEIVQMAADGKSNAEIGTVLNVSPLTVKSHLARVGAAVGVGSRTKIATRCWRAGLIR